MNAGQYEGILNLLVEIRDRIPEPPTLDPVAEAGYDPGPTVIGRNGWPVPVRTGQPTRGVTRNEQETGAYLALVAMDRALDSWIEGAKENHQALEHRNENTGEECWRSFAPSDIRNIINDVARELGLAEFRAPAEPEEDKPL